MKNGWSKRTLADVCEIKPPKSEARERLGLDSLVSFARMEDLPINRKFLNATQVKSLASVISGYTYFAEGDVLLAKITPCFENGKLGIAMGLSNGIGFGSSEFVVLRPCAGLDKEYLYYYLSRADFRSEGAGVMGGAVGQQRVPKEFIETYPIVVPPLPDQRRIVGIIDEAFAGIATAKANTEKNLQNARALFESHLQSTLTQRGRGWCEIQLANVCERLHQGLNTAGEKVKFYDSGYPIIQTRNIDDGVVELDSKIKFMCEEDWELYKDKYRPEVGDVFFTNIGTIGKTAIVETDRDYLIHWNIFKLRPRLDRVTSAFLRYTLEQLTMSGYFEKLQKGGTVDFVTKKMISEALIYLPSIAEQKRFVATLDVLREQTQRLVHICKRKLAALEALKKSLLHQAFTGEL